MFALIERILHYKICTLCKNFINSRTLCKNKKSTPTSHSAFSENYTTTANQDTAIYNNVLNYF